VRGCIGDRRGAAVVEFALVAPVLLVLLSAAFDLGYAAYAAAAVQGAVQKAARDSSLQSAATDALDDAVRVQVAALGAVPPPAIDRRFYRDYAKAAARVPEPWRDLDDDGACDGGEPYTDTNRNGAWDADGGDAGTGGAQDRTVYTVTLRVPRLIPLSGLVGVPATREVTARTVLANQPYAEQASYAADPPTGRCK